MEQDIQRTEKSLKDLKKEITYPAVIYHESEAGNIAPILVLERKGRITHYFWDDVNRYDSDMYNVVGDIVKLSTNSQSTAKQFFIDNATPVDINRVIDQAKKNKIVKPEPKGKTSK
jgi:hypothetical protein